MEKLTMMGVAQSIPSKMGFKPTQYIRYKSSPDNHFRGITRARDLFSPNIVACTQLFS